MLIRLTWTDASGAGECVCDLPDTLTFALPGAPTDPMATAAKLAGLYGAQVVTALSADAAAANMATLNQQADTALGTNATYLAIVAPTTAQVAAQVKALTRQSNGVIRLLRRKLDSAS